MSPTRRRSRFPRASRRRLSASLPQESQPSRVRVLRKMLLEKRQAVIHDLEEQLGNQLNDELQHRIDSALDEGDQSLLDLTKDIDLRLLEMRNKTLRDIDDALRRLKEGTYGMCEECQTPIPERRLMAMPFARTCVACQERRETFEKIEKEEERFK